MSGGRLVVLDRLGREVKRYPLAAGLATLGSDPRCDIRVMLPTVSGHHATVVVHTHQTVVRNVGDGETLVNGQAVSVAALRHGDLLTVGDRSLRWEYAEPSARRPLAAEPAAALTVPRRKMRGRRRGSGGAPAPARSPALQLALELQHRASMPGNASGKQVAIVQPQRRDTTEQNDQTARPSPQSKRQRVSKSEGEDTSPDDKNKRKSVAARGSMTQAEMWIESRKTSPRKSVKLTPALPVAVGRKTMGGKKSTPLRLAVLRRAQSAHKLRVTKIEAPRHVDHTKQAALLLMTGHTPKSKGPSPRASSAKNTPSFVIKKYSPLRRTPRGSRGARGSLRTPTSAQAKTPGTATRSSKRGSGGQTVSILEISDSTQSTIRESTASRRSRVSLPSPLSPLLPTPRKSALKDPAAKNTSRKTESIKFDLSNLEHHTEDRSDVLTVGETTRGTNDSASEDELTLHYSDTSSVQSPSPRKSIHFHSSRMLEKSLGTSVTASPAQRSRSTLTAVTPDSPRRKSNRGTLILQKALDTSENDSRYSRRTTKSLTDRTSDTTVASAFKTRTLSPRTPNKNLETYSIVDLVSIDSNESGRSTSVYNSAGSANSSATAFGTPQNSAGRRTRSTIDPNTLIGSSTPYVKPTRSSSLKSQNSRKSSIKNTSNVSTRSSGSARRSKSLTTPVNSEETQQHISVNSTKISRASKSRSRISDSDLMLISSSDNSQLEDASPRSSKRVSRSTKSDQDSPASTRKSSRRSGGEFTPSSDEKDEGMNTPENRHSPEEVGTPVLSIQSLLNSSQSSFASNSSAKKGRASYSKRKTIGVIRSEPRHRRTGVKSKSLNFTARRGLLRLSKDSSLASDKTDEGAPKMSNEKMVTPKSAVKLVQEAVKNKHSTAKKPQSKRSIIDNLDESDIVKQLFNSPVKRKLSQSMMEFSRKQLFDEDDDIVVARRPTRNTIAVTARTPDNSILDHTEAITPEVFVSPISTPNNSPNLTGIKRLFRKHTPENDLRNVKGVKSLLRTPRTRRSIKNDLTNISGVKQVFAKSPKNRLSDVRVKEVFAAGPKNDLRRVSGVKSLFQSEKKRKSPRNDLSDVRGVKNLFQQNSPKNDLRRISGVKRALQRGSPKNDLSDVRGVKKMFKGQKERNDLNDVSGIEELFNESNTSVRDSESLFDQLVGKPPIKAVYSKSFVRKPVQKPKTRSTKSLHASIDVITNNVEDWIEQELQKRLHKEDDKSKHNATKELQRLATDTVEGAEPLRTSRVRNSTVLRADISTKKSASEVYSAHKLPIKKRSLAEVSVEAGGHKASLPIKKRLVVHSTPVKGRSRLTMNASELGRVSPIAPADTSLRSESTLAMQEQKPTRNTRLTKVATEAEVSKEVTKSPPKASTSKSSPKQAKAASPRARATRARNNKTDNSQTNTKKRRTSLVISKKSPVMSPKPAPRARRGKVEQKAESPAKVQPKPTSKDKVTKKDKAPVQPRAPKSKAEEKTPKSPVQQSPKKTRATRKQEVKPATPKRNTRAKVQKATVVVGKPSPQLKPQAKTKAKATVVMGKPSPQLKPQAKSKAKVEKEAPKATVSESPKTRTRETRAKADSPRKSRKTAASEKTTEEVETKSKRRKVEPPKESLEPVRTRRTVESEPKGKRNKAEIESKKSEPEPEKKERKGRKTQAIVEEKSEPKRTRKTQDDAKKTDTKDSPKPTRSRGKKLENQASVQSEPTTRTRRGKVTENTVIPEVKTRKRKSTSENEIPPKVSKRNAKEVVETKARKGRKTTIETTETEKGNVKQKRSVVKDSKVEISEQQKQDGSTVENVRTVRSRKVVVTAVKTTSAAKEAKATRSGKEAPKETETKTNTRRKKTEPSPVKQAAAVASPAARTRAARNQPQEAAKKATGRSRRR